MSLAALRASRGLIFDPLLRFDTNGDASRKRQQPQQTNRQVRIFDHAFGRLPPMPANRWLLTLGDRDEGGIDRGKPLSRWKVGHHIAEANRTSTDWDVDRLLKHCRIRGHRSKCLGVAHLLARLADRG